MKPIGAVLLAVACGCGEVDPVPAEEYSKNLQRFYVEDGIVLNAVLQDLPTVDEFRRTGSLGAKERIIVWDRTAGSSWYVTPQQVSSEVRNDRAVPSGLFEELQSRNHRSLPMKDFRPDDPRFKLAARDETPKERRWRDEFEEKHPDASAWVWFWLPAYSSDGRQVLVRFSFGPTAHGACGTYVLEKKSGRWTVTWRKLSFYA
jgi:hypothetical protein